MYKCNHGHIFDEPTEKAYNHGGQCEAWGTEYLNVCPECGSDDFDEVVRCDLCGEYITERSHDDYIAFNLTDDAGNYYNDIVCNDCLHDYCVDNFE